MFTIVEEAEPNVHIIRAILFDWYTIFIHIHVIHIISLYYFGDFFNDISTSTYYQF